MSQTKKGGYGKKQGSFKNIKAKGLDGLDIEIPTVEGVAIDDTSFEQYNNLNNNNFQLPNLPPISPVSNNSSSQSLLQLQNQQAQQHLQLQQQALQLQQQLQLQQEQQQQFQQQQQQQQYGAGNSGPIIEVAHSKKRMTGIGKMGKDKNFFVEVNKPGARDFLTKNNWPTGLQEAFLKSCAKIPIRFIITDDSGSMLTTDGHRLLKSGDKIKLIACSRWSELTESLRFHCQLAIEARAPTEIRFLNMSDPILIGTNGDNSKAYEKLIDIFENESPGGQTPLCAQIKEVIEKIREIEPKLRENGQRACVVIASDGQATDGDIAETMKVLKDLPVWVVIRLCTDEDTVVNYWNNIDSELELEMDVLDDLEGEAKEVMAVNDWMVYGEPLHRMREFGASIKEMDLLDEAALSSEQMRVLLSYMISNGNPRDLPHPDVDFREFLSAIDKCNSKSKVWDPISKTSLPWINRKRLNEMYGGNSSSSACNIS